MQLQFVGCGDAFGSGGRFNTCFHLTGPDTNALIDCGASSLIAMKRLGIAPNDVEAILCTHFHADHFGGLPFFILDAQFFSKRTAPLTVAGPEGLGDAFARVMETSFPGSSGAKQRFEISLVSLAPREPTTIGDLRVTGYPVNHGNPGGPFYAYRIEAGDRVVAYSGDTEWTDALIEAGRDADLFIAEAYFRDKQVQLHLDLATLESHLHEIRPKRLMLTHMSDDMLARRSDVSYEAADDGMVVTV